MGNKVLGMGMSVGNANPISTTFIFIPTPVSSHIDISVSIPMRIP